MRFKLTSYGLTDVGLVRQNNEDVWSKLDKYNFFVLADGMGGHLAGEVAAREAVEGLCKFFEDVFIKNQDKSVDEASKLLRQGIESVNDIVFRLGKSDETLKGMGTTICCLYFHPECLVYAHVGDSRIYRLRNKKLKQLTKDHSLLRELVDLGQLDEKHAEDFLYKNIITKAVGTEPLIEPTVSLSDILPGDIYLMCSDGLSDLISKEEIERIIGSSDNVRSAATNLVAAAKERGGHDNVTVVLAKVEELHEAQDIS